VLEQLDQSAFLLMYLADELPAGERAQVEQLLASDASLRQELETLRSAQEQFVREMASADATASTLGEASSINRITRAMRQHQVRRVLTPAAEAPKSVHFWARVPRWGYPIAAAAAVALVYVGYWTIKAPDPTHMVAVDRAPAHRASLPPGGPAVPSEQSSDDVLLASLEDNLRESNRTQDSVKLTELRQTEKQFADISTTSDPLQSLLTDGQPPMPDNE
jgi:anti-sigma factor RsiW